MHRFSRCLMAAALVGTTALAAAAQPPARKLLDKETFFQMESVSSPQISPDGDADRVLGGLRRHHEGPECIESLGDRRQGRAAAPADRRRLEGFRARLVARRQADRVPLGSVGHHAGTRHVGRHARDAAAHEGRAGARRPEVVARRGVAALHDGHPGRHAAAAREAPGDAARRPARRAARSSSTGCPGVRTASARPARPSRTCSWWTPPSAERRGRSRPARTTTVRRHGRPTAARSTCRASAKPDAEYLRGDSEIYAIDVATLRVAPLTDRKGPDNNPVVSPDGRWIAYTGSDDKNETSALSSLYLMDATGGGRRLWAGSLPSSPGGVEWAADGSGVLLRDGGTGRDRTSTSWRSPPAARRRR